MGQVEKSIIKSGLKFKDKKMEHTPKPWEVRKVKKIGIGNRSKRFDILHPLVNKEGEYKGKLGGYHVVIGENVDLTEANAWLIASAPELLEALIQCEKELNSSLISPRPGYQGQQVPQPTIGMDMAQRAIAKSQGKGYDIKNNTSK